MNIEARSGGNRRLDVRLAQRDPVWVRWTLTAAALLVVGVLVLIPLVNIFYEALKDGLGAYFANLTRDPDTLAAIRLTLVVAPSALVANLVFGVAAAWAIARFRFPGRTLLTALIDLPFSVSPVIAGLIFVLIFGLQGFLGPFLRRDGYVIMPYVVAGLAVLLFLAAFLVFRPNSGKHLNPVWKHSVAIGFAGSVLVFGLAVAIQLHLQVWPRGESLKIIFATPGLILATAFVTFPFVARELIPVMEAVGHEEELAALSLGANGWRIFWDITTPNIRWGLIYGIILCNARAMGEFGAVYVVSGRIAGQTDTVPLRIEKLFQEYNLEGAYAVASLLTMLALLTLLAKIGVDRKPGTLLQTSGNLVGDRP